MILYRGTPEPEDRPRPREYASVFFARHKPYAATYGPWVQTYDVGAPKLLRSESPEAVKVLAKFLGYVPDRLKIEDLLFHPTVKLERFLSRRGFDGHSVGENIGIFNLEEIRFVRRERFEWDGRRHTVKRV